MPDMLPSFVVHGLTVSYFTRKVTGYLDYKSLAWRLQPSIGINLAARAAGWNGGIPVVTTPAGEMIWDSTAIILHLERVYPTPAVVPSQPVLAFLAYLLDDFSDEWLYRHAVGSRWLYPENTKSGSWDIAREGSREFPGDVSATQAAVSSGMTACLPRLGTTPANIGAWIAESLLPWQRAFAAHVSAHGFLLGGRPSLADFACFGGNVAHFINDPLCCRWMEESAPAVVDHTHTLMAPHERQFGDWFDTAALPDSLIAVLAETGRHYLPWVAEATRHGAATVRFADGSEAPIETTAFLTTARGILLARYLEARSPGLDALLERAGILRYFADHTDQATAIPDPTPLPRPADNQPFRAG
ncbi:MAG: glutathione S-transferase N-terminal domain-containing protein [bacterium]